MAPGIWPPRTPARGSGSSAVKRDALRASTIWALPSLTMSIIVSKLRTRSGLGMAVKNLAFGLRGAGLDSPPLAFHLGKPAIRPLEALWPMVLRDHHTR